MISLSPQTAPIYGIFVKSTSYKNQTMNTSNHVIQTNDLWQRVKTICLSTIQNGDDKSQAERYFGMISSVSLADGIFKFMVPNKFAAETIEKNYADKLKLCFSLAGAETDLKIEFVVDEKNKSAIVYPKAQTVSPRGRKKSSFISTMPLTEEYTFDEFVRGPSNSFALAAAMGVVKHPGKKGYNPLFIHGGTGLGKTHLMQAIGNELKAKDPSLAICYLTAETFLNEYVNYMKNSSIMDFRKKYRYVDLLLIDDVQFFQKGSEIQEEFFNTFNALQQAEKQIVMTSDVAPKKLPAIEARLLSRFEGGLVQEVETPSYETRLAILKKKAESQDVRIPESSLEFIAENIKSHVRAMEGALAKVAVFIKATDQTLTVDELKRLLKDLIEKEQSLKKLTIEEIQNEVAVKYGVTLAQILSTEKTQSLVTPRQMAMYIARKITPKSLQEIANAFNKKHATIIHGVKTIEKRLDVEPDLKNTLEEILSKFGSNIEYK